MEYHAIGVEHSGLQPRPNQPQQGAVINPLRQHPSHPLLLDGLKALRDVRFHPPGIASALELDGQGIHGIQRTHLRAIPVTTPQEVLLVDGFEEARHCQLQELVCYGGHAYSTLHRYPSLLWNL